MTGPEPAKTSAFITYSRRDKPLVDRVVEDLTSAGIRVWVDMKSIPPSSDWLDQIRLGIESADSYIFVISPDSVRSEVCCLIELPHALQCNKRLISVRARPTKHADIPAEVNAKDWIDFSTEELYPGAFAELIWALTTDLEWLQQHTWLLGLARAWDSRRRDSSVLLAGRVLAEAVAWLEASDAHTDPAPTVLHREFIQMSLRNEDLNNALASVTHGEALVRNNQPTRAREQFERAAEIYQRHQISPVMANLGLWSLSRVCPQPVMWIPSRGSSVLAVGWARRGSALLNVDRNAVVRLFDRNNGSVLDEHELPLAEPSAVAVLPGGDTMAVGSADGHLLLWDLEDGQPLRDWRGHDHQITGIAVAAAHGTLLTGSFDGTAKVWEINTGSLVCELHGHTTPVVAVAISADAQRAITGSIGMPRIPGERAAINLAGQGEDQTLRCWSVPEGTQLEGFESINAQITGVAALDDGALIVTAGLDYGGEPNGVQIWDGLTGQLLGSAARDAGAVSDLAVASTGHRLVLGGPSNKLFVWDADTDAMVSVMEHDEPLSAVALSDDGDTVLAGTKGGEIVCWNTEEDRAVRTIVSGARAVPAVAIDADASRVWAGSAVRIADIGARWFMEEVARGGGSYPLRLWDVPTGLPLGTFGGTTSPMTAMTASRADGVAIATSLDNNLAQWTIENGSRTVIDAGTEETAFGLDVTDDGGILLVVAGTTITVYDLRSHQILRTLRGHEQTVRSAIVIPPRSAIASVSDDGTLRLWSLDTGEQLYVLDHPDAGVSKIAASGDGRWLMSGTLDGARLWDLDSPLQPPIQMFGHDGRVNAVCLSQDGSVGASGGDDGTIRIWHGRTGREMYVLREHEREVTQLAFASDDRVMVSSSMDGTVKIFDFGFGAAVARAVGAARSAFQLLPKSDNEVSCISVLGHWFALRGDWYRASDFFERLRWSTPDPIGGIDAVRCYWAAGMSFDALDELDLLPPPSSADTTESLLRRAVLRDTAGDLTEQLVLPRAGGAELMLDQRPELLTTANQAGQLPLHAAVVHRNLAAVEILLRRGAPVNAPMTDSSGRVALHLACAAGVPAVVRLLLDHGADVRARATDGWTPLHEAANKSAEIVRDLFAHGADPNAATPAGYTPLHRAALLSEPEAVEVLLCAGATVSAVDDGGLTALHFAASQGDPLTIRQLLNAGADPAATDHQGKTPLDLAVRNSRDATAAVLLAKE